MKGNLTIYLFSALALYAAGCTKSELPVVTTAVVTGITPTSASCGGNVTDDGGANIQAKGVCWGTAPNPMISGKKTDEGKGGGAFVSTIGGCSPSTTYYVRAYATNKAGTAYGDQVIFTTQLADNDGNVYNTVTIGSQVWMAENLRTSKYRNGVAIEFPGSDNDGWYNNSTGAYAWYDNDAGNKTVYGALYKWTAVHNPAGLCPAGWHVPSDGDWTLLSDYLGGEGVAGGKLKETSMQHWFSPNGDATDAFGYTARPGGSRSEYGVYANQGYFGYWWSSTQYNQGNGWARVMNSNDGSLVRQYTNKGFGYSVRCVKD